MNFSAFDTTGAAHFKMPEVEKLHILPFCIRRNRQAGHFPSFALYFHFTYECSRVPAHPWGYFTAVPSSSEAGFGKGRLEPGGCCMPGETTSGELSAVHGQGTGTRKRHNNEFHSLPELSVRNKYGKRRSEFKVLGIKYILLLIQGCFLPFFSNWEEKHEQEHPNHYLSPAP